MDGQGVSAGSKIAGREPVYINPIDADARGIKNGDLVQVFNDRGACLAGAFITDNVREGVIRLMTGAWFNPAELESGDKEEICLHGNPNMLTLDKGASKLSQAPIAQTVLVDIKKYHLSAPPINIFSAPEILEAV